jgi:N-acetylmuramoyl-L-alanine amidase
MYRIVTKAPSMLAALLAVLLASACTANGLPAVDGGGATPVITPTAQAMAKITDASEVAGWVNYILTYDYCKGRPDPQRYESPPMLGPLQSIVEENGGNERITGSGWEVNSTSDGNILATFDFEANGEVRRIALIVKPRTNEIAGQNNIGREAIARARAECQQAARETTETAPAATGESTIDKEAFSARTGSDAGSGYPSPSTGDESRTGASTFQRGGAAATGEGDLVQSDAAAAPAVPTPRTSPSPTPTTGAALTMPAGPRKRIIALDPGHGGLESGAAANGLVEKELNLRIALKLRELLQAQGFGVVLTRDTDRAVDPDYKGGGYQGGVQRDLQARVDIANAAAADLFISIHNNGSADPSQAGTEVWYNRQRSFADRNIALAELVQAGLLTRIRALGYPAVDRGVKDDENFRIFRGRVFNIFVLGPGTGARRHEPTQMPGVLGESLIISNPGDAAMLRQERTLDAIAAGYRDGIIKYFERFPE